MVEQFTLRWNKFHSNVSARFVELLEDEELVDVTLAAEGQLLRAHKLVLSICSPYFKRLFKAHPCDHPVVILKDVTLSELRDILHFMYRGEVNICQQDLSSFLQTAELLQVRGLTENPPDAPYDDDAPPKPEARDAPSPDSLGACDGLDESPRARKRRRLANVDSIEAEPDVETKPEPESPSDSDCHDAKQKRAKNRKIGNYKCVLCQRLFTSRYNLKIHVRDKHYSVEDTLQCHICQKRMRNPSCLRVHLYHHRKQASIVSDTASPDRCDSKDARHVLPKSEPPELTDQNASPPPAPPDRLESETQRSLLKPVLPP